MHDFFSTVRWAPERDTGDFGDLDHRDRTGRSGEPHIQTVGKSIQLFASILRGVPEARDICALSRPLNGVGACGARGKSLKEGWPGQIEIGRLYSMVGAEGFEPYRPFPIRDSISTNWTEFLKGDT